MGQSGSLASCDRSDDRSSSSLGSVLADRTVTAFGYVSRRFTISFAVNSAHMVCMLRVYHLGRPGHVSCAVACLVDLMWWSKGRRKAQS